MFTATTNCSGSPHRRSTFHSNLSISMSPKRRHLREPNFVSHHRPPAAADDRRLRRLPEDTELSIFDAERYFKEGRDPTQAGSQKKKDRVFDRAADASTVSPLDGRNRRRGPLPRSPTDSSPARWNNQYGFLSNPPAPAAAALGAPTPNMQRRGPSPSCRWPFGGDCPCSGKKSVDVEEKYAVRRCLNPLNGVDAGSVNLDKNEAEAGKAADSAAAAAMKNERGLEVEEMTKLKLVAESWISGQDPFRLLSARFSPERHFPAGMFGHGTFQFGMPISGGGGVLSFPVLRQTLPAAGKVPNSGVNPPEDPPRDSLEVFQLPEEATAPRKWPRRGLTFSASPAVRVAAVEDDLASDSSSDLFEIESFSTQVTPSRTAYGLGGSLDEAGVVGPRHLTGDAADVSQKRRGLEEAAAASVEMSATRTGR